MLGGEQLTVERGGRQLIANLSLQVVPGEMHVVLGPNGAGKSTLLRLLAGELAPDSGRVELDGRALTDWPLIDLARRRAVLPQSETLRFGFTSAEVVALGRYPHADAGSKSGQRIVAEALAAAGVAHLAQRRYPTLSGGERARVQFARVLAQLESNSAAPARYLLLDEPTASLDLAHQYECLEQVRRFARRGGGVLAILHDPNQAMAFADRVSLLKDGCLLHSGPAEQTLTAGKLSELYGIRVAVHRSDFPSRPLIAVDTLPARR